MSLSHRTIQRASPVHWFGLAIFLAALLSYAAFPSQQRNADGPLQDIQRITLGEPDSSARHILYALVGVPYFRLWRLLGYAGDAAYPMQLLNSVCGALGVLGLFVLLARYVTRPTTAFLLSSAFAFSYAYWYFTEDVFYNTFSFVPVIWSLPLLYAILTGERQRWQSAAAASLGVLSALSILGSQEHVLLVPVLIFGMLLGLRGGGTQRWMRTTAIYLSTLAGCLAIAYAVLAFALAGCHDVSCLISWLRPYGALLPMYQAFGWDRLPSAIWSFLGSIVPLWHGMALRQLTSGIITPAKLLPQLSLLLTLAGITFALATLVMRRKLIWREHRLTAILMLAWLALYISAIVWLDPYGPERWMMPLVAVLVLAALACNSLRGWLPPRVIFLLGAALAATVLIIAAANFTQGILPDHRHPNHDILTARDAATQLAPQDLVISPRWDWTLYLGAEGKRALSLPDLAVEINGRNPNGERLLAAIDDRIRGAELQGGHAYLVNVYSYTPAEWRWITENTGLGLDHFRRYRVEPSWKAADHQVWRIVERAGEP